MQLLRYLYTPQDGDFHSECVDFLYETEQDGGFISNILNRMCQKPMNSGIFYWEGQKNIFENFRLEHMDIWSDGFLLSPRWATFSHLMMNYSIDDLYREISSHTEMGVQFRWWKHILCDMATIGREKNHGTGKELHYDRPVFVVSNQFFEPLWELESKDSHKRYGYRELFLGSTEQIFHEGTIASGESVGLYGMDIPWSPIIQQAYEAHQKTENITTYTETMLHC